MEQYIRRYYLTTTTLNFIDFYKRNDFKRLKSLLRKIKLTSKYISNLLEPYTDYYSINYLRCLNKQLGFYSLIRYVNLYNKEQSLIYVPYLENESLKYTETNWNKNIFKFDILVPIKVFNFIEQLIYQSKETDSELYDFLINNRFSIYCLYHKIYKFWYSSKNHSLIEFKKMNTDNFDLKDHYVKIYSDQLSQYSEYHRKILELFEIAELIYCKLSSSPKHPSSFIKSFRLNENHVFLEKESKNDLVVVRIHSKTLVKKLYYDFISYKEKYFKINSDLKEEIFEEETYFLKSYDLKPKKFKITNDCFQLIKSFEENLIISPLNEVYDFIEKHQSELSESGIKRGKTNLLDKIYNYLNFFELKYSDIKNERFIKFNYFLDKTGRFYTFFNHCPKELINSLFKIKNSKGVIEEVEEVDMCSCHLNMFALLFNKTVLKNKSIQYFIGPELLSWLNAKLDKIPTKQLNAFKNLCSRPDYYEKMKTLVNDQSNKQYTLEEIKKINMFFLYGENLFNPVKNIFKLYFPFVLDFLNEIKKNYNSLSKLSYLLMRLESYFFINKGLSELNKFNITVLPKHDCYYVPKSDVKKVKDILLSIFIDITNDETEFLPFFTKKEELLKTLTTKISLHKKLKQRETELNKYFLLTRKEQIKLNLYTNLFYKDFNDFLIKNSIKNLKIDGKLNVLKFKKIIDRLIKQGKSDDEETIKKLELFYDVFEKKSYEEYIKQSKNYNLNELKFYLQEYLELDLKEKLVNTPIFFNRKIISNTKILTPFEYFLRKTNNTFLKERVNSNNYLIY